jgi:MFS family permease
MTEPTIKASNESGEGEFQLEEGDNLFLEAQNELNKDKWTARRAMIGAMLANFCVGNYFLYGDYNGEVAEWLEMKDHTITESSTLVVQPLWLMCQTVITTIALKLADKFGFRPVIYVAIFIFAAVNFITSYCQSFLPYVIIYGAGSGLSLGLCYLLSLYIAWTYYPNSKAIVTGMVLFATGLNPAILAPVSALIVNLDGVENAPKRVPNLFRFLGMLYGTILILVMLIMPPPKKSKEFQRKTMAA